MPAGARPGAGRPASTVRHRGRSSIQRRVGLRVRLRVQLRIRLRLCQRWHIRLRIQLRIGLRVGPSIGLAQRRSGLRMRDMRLPRSSILISSNLRTHSRVRPGSLLKEKWRGGSGALAGGLRK
jgi:hypothetical protein